MDAARLSSSVLSDDALGPAGSNENSRILQTRLDNHSNRCQRLCPFATVLQRFSIDYSIGASLLHYRHELHQPNSHTRTIFYSSHFRSNERINWNLLTDCRSARTIWPRQIRLFTPNSPRPSWTKKASRGFVSTYRFISIGESKKPETSTLACKKAGSGQVRLPSGPNQTNERQARNSCDEDDAILVVLRLRSCQIERMADERETTKTSPHEGMRGSSCLGTFLIPRHVGIKTACPRCRLRFKLWSLWKMNDDATWT